MVDVNEKIVVEFLKHSGIYQAGDKAGFDPAEADRLIRSGVAFAPNPDGSAGPDEFEDMDRAALLSHARLTYGIVDVPDPEMGDDDLREALRAHKRAVECAAFQTAAPFRGDHPNQGNSASGTAAQELRGNGTERAVQPGRVDPKLKAPEKSSPAGDQLESMDRVHLEAFAAEKCGIKTIDPATSDDQLRDLIRKAAASKS